MKRGKIMQAIISAILAFLLMLFPGCQYLQIQYKAASFNRAEVQTAIIEAIENRDVAALEKLMCPNIKENVPDLEKKITAFYDAIDGEIIENDGWSGTGSSDETENGISGRISSEGWIYEFRTASKSYCLNVSWVKMDTRSLKYMGLSGISLTDMKLFHEYLSAGKTDELKLYVLAKIDANSR